MNVRHHGHTEAQTLRVSRIVERTEVLGPGIRAVVLVQGCHLRCRNCVAPATHALDGGEPIDVHALAARLGALPEIQGITYSGGEPFLQAGALAALIDALRADRPELTLMSYTGYRHEWLQRQGSVAQRRLLERVDLLVDGPYVERWHAPLRWRASTNQRLLALTERHAGEAAADEPAGIELALDERLSLSWVGVPPQPGFLVALDDDNQPTGASR